MTAVATGVSNDLAGPAAVAPSARTRLFYIDNIRVCMIALVISMHACDTYSPFGNWYFTDRSPMGLPTVIAFAFYQSFLQAFFMALLFFVSGTFAAPSLARKGAASFIRERFVRLGIPTLLYMLAVGPLTQYYLSHTWGGGGFVHQWVLHLTDGEWLSETGPMWFAAALLVFSIVYAVASSRRAAPSDRLASMPGTLYIVAFVAGLALSTFLVRTIIPENKSILNMHLGDFPQYILMFCAGLFASRGRWLERFREKTALGWSAVLVGAAIPGFALLVAFGGALTGHTQAYNGGFNLVSAGKSAWESMVCVGMSLGLIAVFRRHFNAQGPVLRFLSDSAFAVYLFHPPFVIALAKLMHLLAFPPLAKAALLTVAAAATTFLAAGFVFRRIPVLKRIL